MKLTPEEAATIINLANRAENLNMAIRHLEAKIHWLKKDHAEVVKDAEAARELMHNAEIGDE